MELWSEMKCIDGSMSLDYETPGCSVGNSTGTSMSVMGIDVFNSYG